MVHKYNKDDDEFCLEGCSASIVSVLLKRLSHAHGYVLIHKTLCIKRKLRPELWNNLLIPVLNGSFSFRGSGGLKTGARRMILLQLILFKYIPLISRVRGPYGKLWNEFFFLPFMVQAQSARAMKTRKEKTRIHNLP